METRDARTNKRVLTTSLPTRVQQQIAKLIEGDRFNVTYVGEWLIQCCLDALVNSLDYLDNARPSWFGTSNQGDAWSLIDTKEIHLLLSSFKGHSIS